MIRGSPHEENNMKNDIKNIFVSDMLFIMIFIVNYIYPAQALTINGLGIISFPDELSRHLNDYMAPIQDPLTGSNFLLRRIITILIITIERKRICIASS